MFKEYAFIIYLILSVSVFSSLIMMVFLIKDCVFPKLRTFLFRSAVPGRRQNTIVVKVPGHDDSHNEDGESGSEASDSVSNSGQLGSQSIGNNVTLITLNSEGMLI